MRLFFNGFTKKKVYFLCSYYFNEILGERIKDFKLVNGPFGPRLVQRNYHTVFLVYGFNPRRLCVTRYLCKDIGNGNSYVMDETVHYVTYTLLDYFKCFGQYCNTSVR